MKPKPCPECKTMMNVVDGWESKEALECPNCGEYEYYVGNIKCIKTAHFAPLKPQSGSKGDKHD